MAGWRESLEFCTGPYHARVTRFVDGERAAGKQVLPSPADVYNAFKLTPLDRVRVVILGQDPYPNRHHAHGLAFSIPEGETDIPQSLRNIIKELKEDAGVDLRGGNLSGWARQGVLLLNRVLTVEAGKSNAHKGIGWEKLTAEAVRLVATRHDHVAFVLWGKQAQEAKAFIPRKQHLILEAPHPSPLSAYKGFFGSKPFSQVNAYMVSHGLDPIDWAA